MKFEILDVLAVTNFVAIALDESPNISKREQLSLVFRYIANLKVCERFVEFIECGPDRNTKSIVSIAISKLEEYMIGSKLILRLACLVQFTIFSLISLPSSIIFFIPHNHGTVIQ